jgi:hypothetical protein
MKKYQVYYYLLFGILITGAFASMAQNEYGMTLLGLTAACFGLLFTFQFIKTAGYAHHTWQNMAELACLVVLSVLLTLRTFTIYSSWLELLFFVTAAILAIVYLSNLYQLVYQAKINNARLVALVVVFYLSLIFFILSAILISVWPEVTEPLWWLAFLLILLFALAAWAYNYFYIDGEKITAFQFLFKLKDRSLVLISMFLLFTLYSGFTRIGWLPKMYSSEFPQGYYKLLNKAETGNEKPVNGKFKHEEFKERYEDFVRKHVE